MSEVRAHYLSATTGSTVHYDHNGKIVSIERAARTVGTSVILRNIFSTMPVREKEFARNIKKEFARLCQVQMCIKFPTT